MQNFNFKIIAIRILPQCKKQIRKCLEEGVFYYLNNDYAISEDGNVIGLRSSYILPVNEQFFALQNKNKPSINLSAIVGKNGDGKSTLIEVVIRLINNFAFRKGIGTDDGLKPVPGLCAELYYQRNDTIYRLTERSTENKRTTCNLFKYSYDNDNRIYNSPQSLDIEEIRSSYFYTLVSNYSHYAYNTGEVDRDTESGSDDEHWLHRIFHKNDGYQVPLSLHPYRNKGLIDTNREKELSKQRVLMTFVQSHIKSEKGKSEMMSFNGKKAVELKLTDIGYSKLQEHTLRTFFTYNAGVRLLQEEIDYLKNNEYDPTDENSNYTGMVVSMANSLKLAFEKFIGKHKRNRELFEKAKIWLIQNGLNEDTTDLAELLGLLYNRVKEVFDPKDYDEFLDIYTNWMEYEIFSWIQIQRIELIDDVCDLWRIEGLDTKEGKIKINVTPETIFKPYQSLTKKEKCLHYMIYKTISIFETYPSYEYPCYQFANEAFFFNGNSPKWKRVIDSTINETKTVPFIKLAEDWNRKSHITLKLRQTYNYYIDRDGIIQSTYTANSTSNSNQKDFIRIEFDKLVNFQKEVLTNLETLPPAFFYWDILFETQRGKDLVSMETFSSGEKQKLFCQSAIVYHLQNISSIGSEQMHYRSVNLILEEIELYFHPEWQRTFCYELMQLIRSASIKNIDSINITFVTHSPYILSDIPKTNVLFLKDGLPDYSMQENTFGSNINGLLKNGFFLPSLPMGEFAYNKISELFKKLHSGEFDEGELPQIKNEIMMVGEPSIRHQLMTLYNTYKQLNNELDDQSFRNFIIRKLEDDKHQ